MRIGLARLTMCCPAGMTNAAGSFQSIASIRFLDQIRQTAFCLDDLRQGFAIADSQSGRITSSIFHFRQTIQQNRATCWFPVKPTIPHIVYPSRFSSSYPYPLLRKMALDSSPRAIITFMPCSPFRKSHELLRPHTSGRYHGQVPPP